MIAHTFPAVSAATAPLSWVVTPMSRIGYALIPRASSSESPLGETSHSCRPPFVRAIPST